MINTVGNEAVEGSGFGMDGETFLARAYAFLGYIFMFASLVSSVWIMVAVFINHENDDDNKFHSTGIALFVQNLLIFASALFFKFGRSESAWS